MKCERFSFNNLEGILCSENTGGEAYRAELPLLKIRITVLFLPGKSLEETS